MSKKLQDKIQSLESLLEQKDLEIKSFKKELVLLNEQIENLLDKLHVQLQFANKIQEKLVPVEIPNIPGFEFSNKFIASPITGGDYFDIFEIEDRFRFSVLLSSCSGYGISSLFLTILLKLTSHIETKKGANPEKVLAMILDELMKEITDKDQVHIFYGIVNRRNYDLTYCHVGDNYVFHYNAQDKNVVELESQYGPIDKKFKKKLSTKTISLNPKDRIIFVSEGLRHIQNPNGISFPKEKIMDILEGDSRKSVHQIRNEIIYEVQKWAGKKELKKDITVLVAEVKERVLKLAKT
jgi:sigma-B regulation protein RsbU (phosphoserine phosphatase)